MTVAYVTQFSSLPEEIAQNIVHILYGNGLDRSYKSHEFIIWDSERDFINPDIHIMANDINYYLASIGLGTRYVLMELV